MKIISGLFSNMVLQRSANGRCHQKIEGTSDYAGHLVARVTNRTSKTAKEISLGAVPGGTFTATLSGLRTGGPYAIELAIKAKSGKIDERLLVRNVLVGDVWVLAGQSNMQGCGDRKDALKADPLVRTFYMDDHWDVAKEPIHDMSIACDEVHSIILGGHPQKAGRFCAGPGMSFGIFYRQMSGVPQGLIPCAHGGTSMIQWNPIRKSEGSKSLYGALLRRVAKNGNRIAGVLWHQGCSDTTAKQIAVYTEKMRAFVTALRADLNLPRLPFVLGQIARHIQRPVEQGLFWNSIRDQQRRLPELIPYCECVPTIDLELDDPVHLNGNSQIRLGHRYALAMASLLKTPGGRKSMTLRGFKIKTREEIKLHSIVEVEFDGVCDSLKTAGRPSGFSILDDNGREAIFNTRLQGNKALLYLEMSKADLENSSLFYGRGTNPFCNITDKEDRSLPGFGPLFLGTPRAITPYVQNWMTSDFQSGTQNLNTLQLPNESGWSETAFPTPFCSRRKEIMTRGGKDEILWHVVHFHCKEAMKINLRLGYDGPVALWLDGKQLFADPNGNCPAIKDRSVIPTAIEAGQHKVHVALSTNHGATWGFYFRVERADLSPEQIVAGPTAWGLPEFSTKAL